ncbi:MAG: hypothetical protein RR357_05540 [Clostridia bacterium]
MITKRYKVYKNFGKCLELTNGEIKALITVDVGPRIIFYGYKGYNVLYEDILRTMNKGGEFFDKNFKLGEKWYVYGGHRLWKATEDLKSYVPDNYPIKVVKTERGAIFAPHVQVLTGLQLTMTVEMNDDGSLDILESFKNMSTNAQNVAPWGITAMRQGGTEIIPLNTTDTGFLPNQNLVFWPYNNRQDKRFTLSTKYAVLRQTKRYSEAFKISLFNHYGWSGYAVGKYFYLRKFKVTNGNYTDYHSNYETYVNGDYLEAEVMGEMTKLEAGAEVLLAERFEIYNDISFESFSDDGIDKALNGRIL